MIKMVPRGKVTTYGQIAVLAGNPRGARQVAWLLHSCSKSDALPWHRVVNGRGGISLGHGSGYEIQKALLRKEGVKFGAGEAVDLECYLWRPGKAGARLQRLHIQGPRRRLRPKLRSG